jgi:hypothetical protein
MLSFLKVCVKVSSRERGIRRKSMDRVQGGT